MGRSRNIVGRRCSADGRLVWFAQTTFSLWAYCRVIVTMHVQVAGRKVLWS